MDSSRKHPILVSRKRFPMNLLHYFCLPCILTVENYVCNDINAFLICVLFRFYFFFKKKPPEISRNASAVLLLPISLERLQTEITHIQLALHSGEHSLIISTRNIFHQIICTLAALRVGAIPLIVSFP